MYLYTYLAKEVEIFLLDSLYVHHLLFDIFLSHKYKTTQNSSQKATHTRLVLYSK